jgi:hypothetical protein
MSPETCYRDATAARQQAIAKVPQIIEANVPRGLPTTVLPLRPGLAAIAPLM